MSQNSRNMNGGAAAPPADAPNSAETDLFVCEECRKCYKTFKGLQLHKRRKHEERYHSENVPVPRVKARWDHEELVLLAREELRLVALGVRFINKELHAFMPSRTLEAIKGVRRKTCTAYHSVLEALRFEPSFVASTPDIDDNDRGDGVAVPCIPLENTIVNDNNDEQFEQSMNNNTNSGMEGFVESPAWGSHIQCEIINFNYYFDIDVERICPGCPTGDVRKVIDDDFVAWVASFAPSRCTLRNPVAPNRPPKSGKRKRRAEYSRVQNLFRRNRSRCAQVVLDGSWFVARAQPTLAEQEQYWRGIFERESVVDIRRPYPVGPIVWEVVQPVLMPELEQIIAHMRSGAPGPDGMVLGEFLKLPREALRARYNLWLLAGYCPTLCCMGETVLIPKDQNDPVPPKHRPITMSDLIIRCYHKLMAKRLGELLPFSDRQKAFRKGDGLGENVMLLNAIIDHHTKNRIPLNIVFIDIVKAFDSVSHDTILIAAERMGVPPPFIGYLREFYLRSNTAIRVDGVRSGPINVKRGVKQGDPMSVHLFNAVIDWALVSLDQELGITIGGERINHLAFADDIALLTRTSIGAQKQLDIISEQLKLGGLFISVGEAGKSASIRIDVDGKKKKWIVNPSAHLHVDDKIIPAKTIKQVYKYLGLSFSAKGASVDASVKMQTYLDNISKAPLKPQQRMYILRVHAIPALFHQLVLARTTAGQMRFLDTKIRGAIKNWLKLPKDTVNAYFYAEIKDGGLGITNLRYRTPLMKKSRLEGILLSEDPAVTAVASTPYVCKMLAKVSTPQMLGNTVILDKPSLRRGFAKALHSSVDGFGLTSCSLVPKVHSWVKNPGPLMSGANYIGAIKIRGNLMPTASRSARGRPLQRKYCDACRNCETLGHILQVCPRTFGPRNDRHNCVLSRVVKELLKRGWVVLVEPAIPTPAGIRRPDIVAWKNGEPNFVIDVTIVADHADLYMAHEAKVEYYNCQHIADWVSNKAGTDIVKFSSVTFNWRGAISPPSYSLLRQNLQMSENFISFLAICVVEKGYQTWLHFSKSTYRGSTVEYTSPERDGIG